ncbi:hypothetical protein B0H13DRAFT_457414 [Mycena leptocephala]|nr:hypothetical protein B0H13DRAFT_457414 [Mycena leptocephala]
MLLAPDTRTRACLPSTPIRTSVSLFCLYISGTESRGTSPSARPESETQNGEEQGARTRDVYTPPRWRRPPPLPSRPIPSRPGQFQAQRQESRNTARSQDRTSSKQSKASLPPPKQNSLHKKREKRKGIRRKNTQIKPTREGKEDSRCDLAQGSSLSSSSSFPASSLSIRIRTPHLPRPPTRPPTNRRWARLKRCMCMM